MRTNNVNDVELLLSKLSKQELCEFIREECAGDRLFRQRFIALGAGVIFHPQSSDYKSRVLDIIEYFAGRYGYVKYDDTFDMNRAVCTILDEADASGRNCVSASNLENPAKRILRVLRGRLLNVEWWRMLFYRKAMRKSAEQMWKELCESSDRQSVLDAMSSSWKSFAYYLYVLKDRRYEKKTILKKSGALRNIAAPVSGLT